MLFVAARKYELRTDSDEGLEEQIAGLEKQLARDDRNRWRTRASSFRTNHSLAREALEVAEGADRETFEGLEDFWRRKCQRLAEDLENERSSDLWRDHDEQLSQIIRWCTSLPGRR